MKETDPIIEWLDKQIEKYRRISKEKHQWLIGETYRDWEKRVGAAHQIVMFAEWHRMALLKGTVEVTEWISEVEGNYWADRTGPEWWEDDQEWWFGL